MRAWSPSTIRNILKRPVYHGVVTWNATKKRDDWGEVRQRRRPEDELVTARREDLRIVPEELWRRVAARMSANGERAVRFANGRLTGRPRKDDVKNLLAGLATCGECGGNLVVETSHRKGGRVAEYVCYRRRHYRVKCGNALRMAVDEMNEAVLQAFEEHALTPEAVELVVQLTERDDVDDRQRTDESRAATSVGTEDRRGPVDRVAPAAARFDHAGARGAGPGLDRTDRLHPKGGRLRLHRADAVRSPLRWRRLSATDVDQRGRYARHRRHWPRGYVRRRLRSATGTRADAAPT